VPNSSLDLLPHETDSRSFTDYYKFTNTTQTYNCTLVQWGAKCSLSLNDAVKRDRTKVQYRTWSRMINFCLRLKA